MSRTLRCLNSPLRTLSCSNKAAVVPRRAKQVRNYAMVAMKTRPEEGQRSASAMYASRARIPQEHAGDVAEGSSTQGVTEESAATIQAAQKESDSWNGPRSTWKDPGPAMAEHLHALFPTLTFPPELAKRILTHGSHPAAVWGHNARYSFMGRRVLESYLLLMLTSSPALKTTHNLDELLERTLNSYVVGQYVGSKWGLGRALRWTPTVSMDKLRRGEDQTELLRGVGLYKIQGDAVSAVMGGIFHQFGGSVAHRVFHTRLLPNLIRLPSLKDGLPETFSADVLAACDRLGGRDAPLLLKETTPSSSTQAESSS